LSQKGLEDEKAVFISCGEKREEKPGSVAPGGGTEAEYIHKRETALRGGKEKGTSLLSQRQKGGGKGVDFVGRNRNPCGGIGKKKKKEGGNLMRKMYTCYPKRGKEREIPRSSNRGREGKKHSQQVVGNQDN